MTICLAIWTVESGILVASALDRLSPLNTIVYVADAVNKLYTLSSP